MTLAILSLIFSAISLISAGFSIHFANKAIATVAAR